MFSTIINFVQNKKRIEYPTSLDPFSSKAHLIKLIEGYIAELVAFQNDENRYIIPDILTYEPSKELAVINKIFSIIEMDQKIYPRMYIYLHINFNTIRDGYKLINKCDEAIRLFNEFKARVEKMVIITALDAVTPDATNDLKLILDTMNPVVGRKDVNYKDEIYDFFDEYNFRHEVIVGYDDIISSYQRLRTHVDPDDELIDFSGTVSIGGLNIAKTKLPCYNGYAVLSIMKKSDLPVFNVDVVSMILDLMRSDNVTSFWMKEINDAVIKKDDYRDSWGFFGPQTPAFLKIQIPDNIKHSMYEYIKFLTKQLEIFGLEHVPEVKGAVSISYFGVWDLSAIDGFLYSFNYCIKHLLYDVYSYIALINKYESIMPKDKFDRLLELIDQVHGDLAHQHIVVKTLLYNHILNGGKKLNRLLKLFELMFGNNSCDISKDEIAIIIDMIKTKQQEYFHCNEKDLYEEMLLCMTFCSINTASIVKKLEEKMENAN